MNPEVVGFGALNLDRLFKAQRIACADEESFITGFEDSPGGSAANTLAGLARLGIRTGYIGKVGRDEAGAFLLDDLRREGIDTRGVIVSERGPSGLVMGFISEKGERALYVSPGVNDTVELEEIDLNYLHDVKVVHFTSFVGETSFKTQKRLIEIALDMKVSFDPGDLYARRGLDALRPIIRRSAIMLPNGREAALITGEEDHEKSADVFLREGVKTVAVKLGSEGCYITDGKKEHHVPAERVEVVDTTGAGDAFNAGFLFGMLRNRSLYDCGKMGNFVAACVIGEIGARKGLPARIPY